jgi:hypothetical protein
MSVLKLLGLLFLIPSLAYGAGFNAESLTASKYLTVGSGTQTTSALSVKGQGVGTGFAVRVADSSAVDRLVVLDNGNVGVGTTKPTEKLSVIGNIALTGGITSTSTGQSYVNEGFIVNELGGVALTDSLRVEATGTEYALFVDARTGYVGIGTSAPEAKLHIW